MPNNFERVARTQENLQFPGGDIEDGPVMNGFTLLEKLSSGESEEVCGNLANLRLSEFPHWLTWPGQSENWGNVEYLADAWGTTLRPNSEHNSSIIMKLGFNYSISFIKRAHLLPLKFANFSEEVTSMSTFDRTAITSFADESWHGMHMSHPRLYSTMAPLVRLTAQACDLRDGDSLILLDAGMSLPYVMASTTRMEGYLKTELKDETLPGAMA
jgi:hypothetical protein